MKSYLYINKTLRVGLCSTYLQCSVQEQHRKYTAAAEKKHVCKAQGHGQGRFSVNFPIFPLPGSLLFLHFPWYVK